MQTRLHAMEVNRAVSTSQEPKLRNKLGLFFWGKRLLRCMFQQAFPHGSTPWENGNQQAFYLRVLTIGFLLITLTCNFSGRRAHRSFAKASCFIRTEGWLCVYVCLHKIRQISQVASICPASQQPSKSWIKLYDQLLLQREKHIQKWWNRVRERPACHFLGMLLGLSNPKEAYL